MNYSTTDKELFQIMTSLERVKKYIVERKFRTRTDYRALTYLWKIENIKGRLMKWLFKLQEFSFKADYIKGEDNKADGLSRTVCHIHTQPPKIAAQSEEQKLNLSKSYQAASGHGTASIMKVLLTSERKWTSTFKEIMGFVTRCDICAAAGRGLVNTENRTVEASESDELWEVDSPGKIEGLNKTNKFILVCIDHFSKWTKARILDKNPAEGVTRAMKDAIQTNGTSRRILSDCGC